MQGERHAYSVRWGEHLTQNVLAAVTLTSQELFRVTAQRPQVWKLVFGLFVANAANLGVSPGLVLNIGIGSGQREETFPFAVNAFNVFELPAQSLVGRIRATPIASDKWVLHGFLAPFFPVGEFA